jgi:Protein of unknown function (DUF1598)
MLAKRIQFAIPVLTACTAAFLLAATANAQTQTTATSTQTTNTSNSTQSTNVTINITQSSSNNAVAGVVVDPNGVLRTQLFMDQTGQLMWQRMNAARAAKTGNGKDAQSSPLRKVSLNRLESVLKDRLDGGRQITDEMKHLAGLTRIEYVFYYPESKDIVVAGPAENFAADLSGRVRGAVTGRPVIELDDLVTALRAFPPAGKGTSVISCSIDPTQEGLARMQNFLREIGTHATPGDTEQIVTGLKDSLGLEKVSIRGVPATTHFAQVLVEADYRMKLIGIGLEHPQVKQLVSYVDRASPSSVSRNALQRWYFVPDYQCLKVTEDDLAMELLGDGVKLVNADELVGADGSRSQAATIDGASRAFTENFTRKYAELAAVSPVYSQLRNCIDLAIVAAYLQHKDFYRKAGWTMPLFGDEAAYSVQTLSAPQSVETAVASVWKGNRLMTPVGGGVEIKARHALDPSNIQSDTEGKVAEQRSKNELKNLAKDQWWWD